MANEKAIKEIKLVLEKVNEAYIENEPSEIYSFMRKFFTEEEDSLIIGSTFKEWKRGRDEARKIILDHWKDKGNWSFNHEDAQINVHGEIAWVSMTGDFRVQISSVFLEDMLSLQIKSAIDDKKLSSEEKMWKIIQNASFYLRENKKGDEYFYPFRFTGVLIKKNSKWLFHQMHFSVPNLSGTFPAVRIFD
ncbi:MAG: hypothetical protein GF308_06730 [Candidatus Heimdallarchaeota archaeon]|nr:hypothetical protein [Candidatus Heimdallarchaeota archaeon]